MNRVDLFMGDGPSETNFFGDLIPYWLCIQAKSGRIPELIKAIDAALNSGWQRDREAEEKCAPSLRSLVTCYRCDARDGREAAVLTLCLDLDQPHGDFLRDSHVGFYGTRPLGTDWEITGAQRDRILFDFRDNVLSRLPADSYIKFGLGVDRNPENQST